MSIFTSLLRDWGTDPLVWVTLTGLPLIWFALRGYASWKAFWSWTFSLAWVGLLVLVSAPRVVNPMVDAWETQYPLDKTCGDDSALVVLAGGLDRRATEPSQTEYLYPSSHIRSSRAASMASAELMAPIVVSGKGLYQVSEAEMMTAYLTQRGIDEVRIVMDGASGNTHESAVNVAALVAENGWDSSVRLVTSALHMPRAMGVFEKNGLAPCAIPVEFLAVLDVPWFALMPQTTALAKFRTYLHERIGVFVYRSKGWL